MYFKNKDLINLYLEKLEEKDILSFLLTNKCLYNNFLLNETYLERFLKKRYSFLSSREHEQKQYRKMLLKIIKCKEELCETFNYKYEEGDLFNQYNVFKDCKVKCNYKPDNFYIVLYYAACSSGELTLLKYTRRFMDEEWCTHRGLICACMNNKLNIVKYLVETENANVSPDGDAPLRTAFRYGYLDLAKYLIEQGAYLYGSYGEDLVEIVCERGHLDILKYLFSEFEFSLEEINRYISISELCSHKHILDFLNGYSSEISNSKN